MKGLPNDIRFAAIVQDDISNGDGLGEVLFLQGCTHHCKGCHNQCTWDFGGGYRFTEKYFQILMEYFIKNPIATRLTLSGGDPLDSLAGATYIAQEFKANFPSKQLWVYTGYLYEDLVNKIQYKPILDLIDILVDGEFDLSLRDTTLYCKGSSNQRVIDIKATMERGCIVTL